MKYKLQRQSVHTGNEPLSQTPLPLDPSVSAVPKCHPHSCPHYLDLTRKFTGMENLPGWKKKQYKQYSVQC